MMDYNGESLCVVCPLVNKKAKKRASHKRRQLAGGGNGNNSSLETALSTTVSTSPDKQSIALARSKTSSHFTDSSFDEPRNINNLLAALRSPQTNSIQRSANDLPSRNTSTRDSTPGGELGVQVEIAGPSRPHLQSPGIAPLRRRMPDPRSPPPIQRELSERQLSTNGFSTPHREDVRVTQRPEANLPYNTVQTQEDRPCMPMQLRGRNNFASPSLETHLDQQNGASSSVLDGTNVPPLSRPQHDDRPCMPRQLSGRNNFSAPSLGLHRNVLVSGQNVQETNQDAGSRQYHDDGSLPRRGGLSERQISEKNVFLSRPKEDDGPQPPRQKSEEKILASPEVEALQSKFIIDMEQHPTQNSASLHESSPHIQPKRHKYDM